MARLSYPFGTIRPVPSLKCNLGCPYCTIFTYQDLSAAHRAPKEVEPEKWIDLFQRLDFRRGCRMVFGSGEPMLYEGCADLINVVPDHVDILVYSNLSKPTWGEISRIKRRNNVSFYCTYHVHGDYLDDFIEHALYVMHRFRVLNFHTVPHSSVKDQLQACKDKCAKYDVELNIDHPYVGNDIDGFHFYGDLITDGRFAKRFQSPLQTVQCKTSFNHAGLQSMGYPIGPDGTVFVCWRYLIDDDKAGSFGNVFDESFEYKDEYFTCDKYGDCNICAHDRNILDMKGRELDNDTIGRKFLC